MTLTEIFAVATLASITLTQLSVFLPGKYRLVTPTLFCLSALFGMAFSIFSLSSPLNFVLHSPVFLGLMPVQFASNCLSSAFCLLLCLLLLPFALFSQSYIKTKNSLETRFFWLTSGLFVLSMGSVLLSSNAILFLILWEVMSLSSAALVASEMFTRNTARAALIYLSATRVATALIAGGFLAAYYSFKSWNFCDWHFGGTNSLLAEILITLGCLIKSGIWPFHIWLPYAYQAAPAPSAALMSGLMGKVPIIILIQFFLGHSSHSLFIAYILIVLGAISTLWGVIFSLVQNDLKKILAYSSVENLGMITLTLGICQLCKHYPLDGVASVLFAALLFHIFNHAIFKSLLFLGAGAIYKQTRTSNINELGGLSRNMPGTFLFFLIGGAALCSLPPLNGFCSKWLIYEGLFKLALNKDITLCVIALLLILVLIIAGALSLATVSKTISIVFSGRPRTKHSGQATECDFAINLSQGILAVLCILPGLFCVQSKYLWISVLFAIIFYAGFLKQNKQRKIYSTWECGFGALSSRMQQTSESFSQPIAVFFSPLLRYKIVAEITGKDRRHFPERVKTEQSTQSVLEAKVYTPLVVFVSALGRHINRLQAGSIHIYLSYLLLTLITLICLELVW